MNNPLMFKDQNLLDYFNIQPSEVKGRENYGTQYYKRMLWTKLYSVFEFDLPESWKVNFFRFWLFHFGSIAVIYTNEFGWIAQPYSVLELDLYYNPKKIQVYNSFVKDPKVGIVGINAGVINLMDDFYGLDSLITRYAEMLADCDKSVNINLMNCNVSLLFEAESKKQAEEIKEAYGRATAGEPLVTINKEVMNGSTLNTLMPSVKQNYIAGDILTARRAIMNAFLTEIGIRNANMDKKERLVSQEVEENNDETRAIISVMYDNMKKAMNEINAISGLNLDVRMRYTYEQKGAVDINGQNNTLGLQ